MERVKRLAGDEIELGMKMPMIESRASKIPMDKGNYICCHKVQPIKIFEEYVGANMGIQIPLLVIDRRTSRSCLHGSRTRRVYTLKVR